MHIKKVICSNYNELKLSDPLFAKTNQKSHEGPFKNVLE
jgi:hypothetical protein